GGPFSSRVANSGKSSHFFLYCLTSFCTQSHKLDPDPYTREAIAYFATSLNFEVRVRQAKSEVYDGAFRKMCRSVHEHPVRAEIGRANGDLASPSFEGQMHIAQLLNSSFTTSGFRGRVIPRALFQERTPSLACSDDAA